MKRFLTILMFFIAASFAQAAYAQNPKTYIHPRVEPLVPIYLEEINRLFPDIPEKAYPLALTEHESCISLKHGRCWKSTSELKSAREQGVGLAMLTRTWNADGSVRFDTLTNLKNTYKEELKELSWLNVKERPDLQIRAMMLIVRDDYKAFYKVHDRYQRLVFTDIAYNGGRKHANQARVACGLAKNCNPDIWFDNAERFNPKSTKPLYGNRSARDINNQHARDVFFTRLPKFRTYLIDYEKKENKDGE